MGCTGLDTASNDFGNSYILRESADVKSSKWVDEGETQRAVMASESYVCMLRSSLCIHV